MDSYGVDHSGFSTQDELQYQTARAEREKQLAENLQRQGVTESSFPQYGTNFWGDSENNFCMKNCTRAVRFEREPFWGSFFLMIFFERRKQKCKNIKIAVINF